MSSPFPPSSPDPFGNDDPFGTGRSTNDPFGTGPAGNDPFGTGPSNPTSDPFVTTRRSSGRGAYVLVLLVLLAMIGGVTWWVLSKVLDESDEQVLPRPIPSSVAPIATPAPTEPPPGVTAAPGDSATDETSVPGTEAPTPTVEEIVLPETYLAGEAGRGAVVGAVEAMGIDQPRLLQVVLYPQYVIFEFQVPDEPDFVDRVVWRNGTVASRDAVRLSPTVDLDLDLFDLDDVDWLAVDGLVAGAVELTDVRDGEVTHVIVQRFRPFFDDVRFRVYVNGPRSSGSVEAAADGTVTRVFAG